MTRAMLGLCAGSALLVLTGCADTDNLPQRGFDQDISATHDGGAPTTRNLRDTSPGLFSFSR